MQLNKALNRLGFYGKYDDGPSIDYTLEDLSDGKGIVITWFSELPQPTTAEIQTASDAYEAEWDLSVYARKRQIEYPPIGDQLDALWKGGDEATAMKVIIDKVKSDNPKG